MKLTKTEAFLIEILRAADKPLSQAELHAALYAGIPEPPQVNNACVQVYRLNKKLRDAGINAQIHHGGGGYYVTADDVQRIID